MGSDTNIIAASAAALADLLEYATWTSGASARRRDENATSRPRTETAARRSPSPPPRPPHPEATDEPVEPDHQCPRRHDPPRLLDRDLGLQRPEPRAAILAAGDRKWEASAEGNGAIDALYRAVDQALADVLLGHPRLLAYDIHALGEGSDTIGVVTVRARRRHTKERGAASTPAKRVRQEHRRGLDEAYVTALNAMLASAAFGEGAADAASGGR